MILHTHRWRGGDDAPERELALSGDSAPLSREVILGADVFLRSSLEISSSMLSAGKVLVYRAGRMSGVRVWVCVDRLPGSN